MARIRSIKPEFFHHEELAELSLAHQLLFIGLWTLADREGRLEDRPKRIKAAIFPYRDMDVDALLWDLHRSNFVSRYAAAGKACIAVLNFGKHQRPHPKEAPSELPPPPEEASAPPPVPPGNYTASREKDIPSREKDMTSRVEALALAFPLEALVEAGAVAVAPPALPPPAAAPEKPSVPGLRVVSLPGAEFFQDAQAIRREVYPDSPGQKKPPAEVEAWYSTALEQVGGERPRLLEAFRRYALSPFGQTAQPRAAFALFMAEGVWTHDVPSAAPAPEEAPRCVVPGCSRGTEGKRFREVSLCHGHTGQAQNAGFDIDTPPESVARWAEAQGLAEVGT
jgi:hypothetical protein